MKQLIEKFCECCGQELKSQDLPSFNQFTGKRDIKLVCTNLPTCPRACGQTFEGHKFKFWTNVCKKCGLDIGPSPY